MGQPTDRQSGNRNEPAFGTSDRAPAGQTAKVDDDPFAEISRDSWREIQQNLLQFKSGSFDDKPGKTTVPAAPERTPPGGVKLSPSGEKDIPSAEKHLPPGVKPSPSGEKDTPSGEKHLPPGEKQSPPAERQPPPTEKVPPKQPAQPPEKPAQELTLDDLFTPRFDPVKKPEPAVRPEQAPRTGPVPAPTPAPPREFEPPKPRPIAPDVGHEGDGHLAPVVPAPRPARFHELFQLEHSASDHGRRHPDAVVRVPENFDPSKPFNIAVYNHGFYNSAHSAIKDSNLDEAMQHAAPNTVLIVPEWQVSPAAKSSDAGDFGKKGEFKAMLQEIFDKTPELHGKTLKNVANIDIFAHSAGYTPAEAELYNNGLEHKIRSVTSLDSLYDSPIYDAWISDNLHALSAGQKRFYSFGNDKEKRSEQLADRVRAALKSVHLPDTIYEDTRDPKALVSPSILRANPMLFKFSNATVSGHGPHGSLPELYIGRIEESLR